jgi:hypothetical protein
VSYDSRPDTRKHIARVRDYLDRAVGDLVYRKAMHDASKLAGPITRRSRVRFPPALSEEGVSVR